MGQENEEHDDLDLGAAIQSARALEDDDTEEVDVVSDVGLPGVRLPAGDSNELPYVRLLNAAVSMVKAGELSMEEYVAGVKKLDAIADNALKVYAIPAVKTSLPGKLTEDQNSIVSALETQIHKMKEGLGMLLSYPQNQAIGVLETGLETTVNAMNTMAKIQADAEAERERILREEQEDKARRAQQAAAAEAE